MPTIKPKKKNPSISFSDSDENILKIKAYATSKGLTPSAFAKFAVYQYMNKYPTKKAVNKP